MVTLRQRGPGIPTRAPCLCPSCGRPFRERQTGRVRCRWCGTTFDFWITAPAANAWVQTPEPEAEVPEKASEDAPACALHPENASTVACSRCGDFICPVCVIRIEGADLCPRCFEHRVDHAELRSLQRKFRLPDYALAVGVLSLFAGCMLSYFASFVGMFAIGLGVKALLQIRRQPALQGRGKAIAAIILGTISAIGYAVLFIMFIMVFSRIN